MSFRFRLDTMLKLREQTRDERRRDVGQAYEAERILREQVGELHLEIDSARARTRNKAGQGSVNVDDLIHARRYELIMKSQLTSIEAQIAQVLQEIEKRRQMLVDADREVKILEKLREKQREQFVEVHAKRDAQQLDEAALRGFARRREVTP